MSPWPPFFDTSDVPIDPQADEPISIQSGAPQESAMNHADGPGPGMGAFITHPQLWPASGQFRPQAGQLRGNYGPESPRLGSISAEVAPKADEWGQR